ncbi:hypothetical protein HK104_007119 [Borealophlyctis nickersoniae]|nr:hypothetical protein HK104_007119 [Borealophlyctis nickersoniae]
MSRTIATNSPLHSEVLSLYRSFMRVQRRWPPQETREARFSEYIHTRLRQEFTAPSADFSGNGKAVDLKEEDVRERVVRGREELAALKRMCDGEVERKPNQYPLSDSSPLRAFLPAKRLFSLLDQESQERFNEKSNLFFLKTYLASKLKGEA